MKQTEYIKYLDSFEAKYEIRNTGTTLACSLPLNLRYNPQGQVRFQFCILTKQRQQLV